jgi:hypothetical protein
VALVFIAVLWTSAFIVFSLGAELLAWDVRFAYLPAAERDSPRALAVSRSRRSDPRGPEGIRVSTAARGRAATLTKLPIDLVALIVTAGMLVMLFLTLRLLGNP